MRRNIYKSEDAFSLEWNTCGLGSQHDPTRYAHICFTILHWILSLALPEGSNSEPASPNARRKQSKSTLLCSARQNSDLFYYSCIWATRRSCWCWNWHSAPLQSASLHWMPVLHSEHQLVCAYTWPQVGRQKCVHQRDSRSNDKEISPLYYGTQTSWWWINTTHTPANRRHGM